MTLRNEKFEELLAQQLSRELEPQRGKAAAAFQAQIAAEARQQAAEERAALLAGGSKRQESWARREVTGRSFWLWTGVPSLIAAALAVVVTLHFTGAGTKPTAQKEPETLLANVPPIPPISSGVGTGTVVSDITLSQSYPGVIVINPNAPKRGGIRWGDPLEHEAYRLPELPRESMTPAPVPPQ